MRLKLIFLLFMMMVFTPARAQEDQIEIKKASLDKIQSLSELVPGLASDCEVKRAEIVFKSNGTILAMQTSNSEIELIKKRFSGLSAGSTIYFEVKQLSCKSKLRNSYKYKVIE